MDTYSRPRTPPCAGKGLAGVIINALAADFERRTGFGITQLLRPGDMPLHIKQKLDGGATFDAASADTIRSKGMEPWC